LLHNIDMKKPILLALIALLLACNFSRAQTTQPAIAIPASGEDDNAVNALKKSTRHGEWVEIALPDGSAKIKTWVVYPERSDKAPVVIVIHEIFGMSDWVRGVTDELAANGFIALAPDLLSGKGPDGGGTESLSSSAIGQAIMKLTPAEQFARLDAVRDYALTLPSATQKNACIGFCWGGGASFHYATHQPKLDAAVVFYGTPPSKDEAVKIECPVLGCYGGKDARITSTVDPTTKLMESLKKVYSPHVYDGAGHGFLRQHTGANADANVKASEQAWPETISFLKKALEQN
jgi:carboxymethylenebutenolidase